ncbi:unnamed protein product [Cylindrotheca closterium]|uniref:Aminotransferase class I/classII large domain-containing protein n=1 Tax=Cylindrotheca closterium TaxID=2856 RepID=A0AAD2JLP8_9STRA|nr:unnamed protein product [Cylindrotheca closterium]
MVKSEFTSLSRNAEHMSVGSNCPSWNRHATSAVQTRLYHSTGSTPAEDDRISAPRAAKAVGLLPTYLADARAVEQYSLSTPNGALQLSVAENQLLEDLLVPSLTEFSSTLAFPADAIYYQPTQGRESFRKAMAAYLEDMLKLSKPMDADGIVVGAGCNAVLENLCISLAEPGEGVMIPTPYYAAFEFDLVARAGLSISPVTTMEYQDFDRESNIIPHEAYYPNRASLDAAVKMSLANGVNPRILLLSHPQNPLGICYPPEVVSEIIDWCREKKIHLITDEIYAGSVYRDDANFVSVLELASTGDGEALGLGPYIHLVYALSKDFALSGLRVGALYSENPKIRVPLQKLNDLCCISSHTQLLVEKMLTTASDDPNVSWTQGFRATSHERLRKRGDAWHSTLDELGIPYLKGTAGLFVWMDFQEFLPAMGSDDERERKLYLELLKEFGLLFTPGSSMKNEKPGFFRCVFTAASNEEFDLGMKRLKKYVHAKRS